MAPHFQVFLKPLAFMQGLCFCRGGVLFHFPPLNFRKTQPNSILILKTYSGCNCMCQPTLSYDHGGLHLSFAFLAFKSKCIGVVGQILQTILK